MMRDPRADTPMIIRVLAGFMMFVVLCGLLPSGGFAGDSADEGVVALGDQPDAPGAAPTIAAIVPFLDPLPDAVSVVTTTESIFVDDSTIRRSEVLAYAPQRPPPGRLEI